MSPCRVATQNLATTLFIPTAKLLADWECPVGFSIGSNFGLDSPARDATGDKFARFLYAVAIGHPFPGLEDWLSIFVEGTGAVTLKDGKADEHFFDTGLTYLLTDDLQLDLAAQIGLNDAANDFQLGLGLSYRH